MKAILACGPALATVQCEYQDGADTLMNIRPVSEAAHLLLNWWFTQSDCRSREAR